MVLRTLRSLKSSIIVVEEIRTFCRFENSPPPHDGFYWVKWEFGDNPVRVFLMRVKHPFVAEENLPEWEHWLWSWSETDDPKSIAMNISEPQHIQWAT